MLGPQDFVTQTPEGPAGSALSLLVLTFSVYCSFGFVIQRDLPLPPFRGLAPFPLLPSLAWERVG